MTPDIFVESPRTLPDERDFQRAPPEVGVGAEGGGVERLFEFHLPFTSYQFQLFLIS